MERRMKERRNQRHQQIGHFKMDATTKERTGSNQRPRDSGKINGKRAFQMD